MGFGLPTVVRVLWNNKYRYNSNNKYEFKRDIKYNILHMTKQVNNVVILQAGAERRDGWTYNKSVVLNFCNDTFGTHAECNFIEVR